MIGLFFIGLTLVGDGIFIKETTCTYTVGYKTDEVCGDISAINFNYTFPSVSDKIGFMYFATGFILCLFMVREFLLALWHFDDYINHDY